MLQKCLHGSVVALFLTKHGHQILWLPPYSPDLNPIEKMWAWVKA
ncbi:transposase [Acinetobacter sp. NS4_7]